MGNSQASAETVFVVDDEPEVRESLARLLRSAGLAVQAFGSAQEFLDGGPPATGGCLVLDVNMPGRNGLELHQELKARGVDLPVIYLTGRANVAIGVRAMKQGARDFLEKPVDANELLGAIADAMQRNREDRGRRRVHEEIRGRLQSLSPREHEVMQHVVRGRLNKQIAADLGITEMTVKVHRSRVMDKMQVRSVAELVHLCDQIDALSGTPSGR
jgi:FixJ family two-component response regulator